MFRVGALRGRLRESLWWWSLISVVGAVALGVVLTTTRPLEHAGLEGLLFTADASTAQGVLGSLLAALVTAASVVASLTIVALQTASSQFSPRLLRNFVRDRATHLVLAVFVGTSGFIVVLLIDLGAGDPLPSLAVTLALVGVLASVVTVAYFFHHVSRSIRIEAILGSVADDTMEASHRVSDWLDRSATLPGPLPEIPDHADPMTAKVSGYVQEIDVHTLWHWAKRHGRVVCLISQIGQPVTAGAPVAWTWPTTGAGAAGPDEEWSASAVTIGYQRLLRLDVALGMRQLVDVALRALSPAVNDPYTAMQAIDHLGAVLARIATCPLGDRVRADDHGEVRLGLATPTFTELAHLSIDQIRHYGAGVPAVAERVMTMLRDVAAGTDGTHRDVLRTFVAETAVNADRRVTDDAERARVAEVAEEVLAWFDRGSLPSPAARGGF